MLLDEPKLLASTPDTAAVGLGQAPTKAARRWPVSEERAAVIAD